MSAVLRPRAFDTPIFVTKPILPDLNEYADLLKEIWDAEWLTNGGAQHQNLERDLASYLKSQYLSLFNNGTIALIVACQAFNLSGEVITTPFTFPATPHVLSWNGIQPVFCDIDPMTMNIDHAQIETLITNKTTGILGVHVYGTPCDVYQIGEIADKYGLRVIYDAAHAFGTEVNGTPITHFGDATMLSFHATKLFHTAEGGALVVHNSAVKARVDLLKNFGIKSEAEVVMPGINGKMSELHAAMGRCVLRLVDGQKASRRRVRNIYDQRLNRSEILRPVLPANVTCSEQYYPIRISNPSRASSSSSRLNRDTVYAKLREFNVHARKYFYPLCSEYSCYKLLPSSRKELLPNSHKAADEVLCLPFHGSLSDQDVHHICDILDYCLDA